MILVFLWPALRKFARKGKLRWIVLAAAVVALLAGVTLAESGSAGTAPAARAGLLKTRSLAVVSQPAHQLAELNFLVGTYTCRAVSAPGAPPATSTWTTEKVLDGNYYQMSISAPLPGGGTAVASWTFGWDSVDLNYFAGYFDSTGTFGTAVSAGWKNGQLRFPGNYTYMVTPGGIDGVGKGEHINSQDDFAIIGPDHFTDSITVYLNGKWTPKGSDDCRRVGST